jgi:hypothetical protein
MNRHLTRPDTPAAISTAAVKEAVSFARQQNDNDRKRAVMETLTAMWLNGPHGMRLGQLLTNAVGGDIFFTTDDDLVRHVKDYLRKVR